PLFPLAPASPLFPYTTLFRSGARSGLGARSPVARLRGSASLGCFCRLRLGLLLGLCGGGRHACVDRPESRPPSRRLHLDSYRHPDRKSTRLNSSHQIISYAVF